MGQNFQNEIVRLQKLMGINQSEISPELFNYLSKMMHEGIRPTKNIISESNLVDFAKDEIDQVVKKTKKDGDTAIIAEFVPEILKLIQKFADSGQSGGSAPYTAGAITKTLEKLLMFKPLLPVTGDDDEWGEPCYDEVYQNKRYSAIFKDGKKGKPYFIDAVVFKNQDGLTFTSNGSVTNKKGEKISSKQYIKKFPFEPKIFTIDVIEKEIAPDDWESTIKDEKQLEEVWKYYDKYTPEKKK